MSFGKTPPSVSAKLTFPCTECNFEAQSARQLSRHKAVTHTQNALKCVLCPFVTAYQTNLLRHRKDVHGICGSKGNKSCKFCGFVSEDNDTLIHHQIEFHQDILKSAQAKFAKELVSAGGDESIADFSANFESMSEELMNGRSSYHTSLPKKKTAKMRDAPHLTKKGAELHCHSANNLATTHHNNGTADMKNDFDDFWKAGFMEHAIDPSLYLSQAPLNMDLQTDSLNTSRSSTPRSHSSHNMSVKDLPATRIRRQYTCNDCGIRTVNPREFLYHRRDAHGHRIKIVECPHCVYACQYVQKLQRHLLLVHKLQTLVTPSGEPIVNGGETDPVSMKRKYKNFKRDFDGNSILDNEMSNSNFEADINDDDDQSFNDEEYEPMNNFEMSFNEYENDLINKESIDTDKEDENVPVNLECSFCKIKFADIISAQKHYLKNHKYHNPKQYSVNNDESSPIQMTTSQRKVFDSIKNVHSCNYCGYKTRWISELERHVRVHSKEKPFKCMFCDFKSKWKGDLNRHVQRYHSTESASGDIESDASLNYAGNSLNPDMSPATSDQRDDDETANEKGSFMPDTSNDDFPNSYECLMEVDDSDTVAALQNNTNENSADENEVDNEDSTHSPNSSNTAKMYKCTYCDFMCSTASRFHVHYVQHLNTKPFQCSICGHRSNWEWDVTKHIKMKAQRDPNHEKARPVLIHDSGKRDYSKYNKFVIWVGQAEAEMANTEANKIDFRAKRFRTELEEPEAEDNFAIDNLLTPEVCFEVDNDAEITNNYDNDYFNSPTTKHDNSFELNAPVVKSVIVHRHFYSRNRLIFCGECEFKHKFARVMVAHMASHFEKKPYACKLCEFDTNWREVIVSHNEIAHKHMDPSDFEMRFRCVIDENCTCHITTLEELAQMELETDGAEQQIFESPIMENNSSLIEPNIYEEKAVIRCELCPFLTTNLKKMNIHCRFHNPSKGSLKCKFCPYFVNNKDKLMRHQKLHQKFGNSNSVSYSCGNNANENGSSSAPYSHPNFGPQSSTISCSLCSFQTSNSQQLNEHMKVHDSSQYEPDSTENVLSQSLQEKSFSVDSNIIENAGSAFDHEFFDNSVSLIDVNNMKNGNAKKFSYVCPDCPAAFKSPGDYKIHAVFHSSIYQHSCPYCTYKARNKPQLCKHLYVHTAEYIAKRANSYPDGTKHLVGNQEMNNIGNIEMNTAVKKFAAGKQKTTKTGRKHRTKMEFPMKPVKVKLNNEENGKQKIVFNNTDLMASQEFLETKEYLQRINSGIKNRCMYRCSTCPAVFTKVNTLIYHMTLHDQKSQFTCDSCTYSTTTEDNLSIHSLLHNLTESQAALGYNFNYNCHKCPAGFSKRTRLEKHLSLHGAKFNWKCDKCDYSVRYAATLVKHRALHLINPNFRAIENASIEAESVLLDDKGLPPNLRLKLNLGQLHSNGVVDVDDDDDDDEQAKVDTLDLTIDEEISQDSNEEDDVVHPQPDIDELNESDSFDGVPEVSILEDAEAPLNSFMRGKEHSLPVSPS